jgi:KipI family sensor histidine kinase inhibitor
VNTGFAIENLGENALLLRFGDSLEAGINARVHALAAELARDRPRWLLDIVPAFATVALCIDLEALTGESEPLGAVRRWLAARTADDVGKPQDAPGRHHVIPVRYGGSDGPDLEAVARHAGIDADELIQRHTAATYRVAMLGFAAGFPYLIGMDRQLAMPRRDTPRTDVAAGSVGIGGAQTGIYPRRGPGGWQIIGRTAVGLFDAGGDPPALLGPGDTVGFVPEAAQARPRQ